MSTATVRRPPAPPRSRTRQRPSRRQGDLFALAVGIGAGITLAVTIPALVDTATASSAGLVNALGIVTAMAGTYLALVGIVLMSRLPWLEREVGQDRLTAWHRMVGPWSLILITLHVVLTTWGYASTAATGWWTQLVDLTFGVPWMLPAAVATLIMIGLGVISWRPLRRRMSYETWHVAHLYFYLAVALAFGHQLESGSVFVDSPIARAWWIALYAAIAVAIVAFRIALPLYRSSRHRLRVSAVVPVDATTTHVFISGRRLDLLNARGGQWFTWRFATRRWWWQGHPYSLSAVPVPTGMRITVRHLGDQSRELAALRPGTRVVAEGPYGAFRLDRRHTDHVVLIGAGVGITPIRALLDELPPGVSADVLYRVSHEPAALSDELTWLAENSNGWIRVRTVVGSRRQVPLTPDWLAATFPHLAQSDVYVCGPTSFTGAVRHASRALGVPSERIHDELFEF